MRKTVNQTVIMCSELSRNLKTEGDGCYNCNVILPAELKETLLYQQNHRWVRACPLGFHSFAHPSRRWGLTRGTSCPKHRSKKKNSRENSVLVGPHHLDSGDGWNDGYEQYKLWIGLSAIVDIVASCDECLQSCKYCLVKNKRFQN